MIFDGTEITLHDSVYDVAYGSGTIIEINEKLGIFRVSFGSRNFAYKPTGEGTFPRKTLFWRNPIDGFVPPKNDKVWDQFTKIRKAVLDALR